MRHEDGDSDAKDLRRTVFHDIRDDVGGKLPEKEKHPMRLMADASVILGAGTETTARTMAVTTYYLIQNPEVGENLRRELKTVMPKADDQVSLPQLEALPYLVCILPYTTFRAMLINLLECSYQRRPPCSPWRKLPPTTHRHWRRPPIRSIHYTPRNTRHGISLPPAHGPQDLP